LHVQSSDSGSVAFDPHDRSRPRAHRQANLADGGELERIAQQVEQDLPQPRAVALDATAHVRRDGTGKVEAFLPGSKGHRLHGLLDEQTQIELVLFQFQLSGLDLSGFSIGPAPLSMTRLEQSGVNMSRTLGCKSLIICERALGSEKV
jgi:hypothetical protein